MKFFSRKKEKDFSIELIISFLFLVIICYSPSNQATSSSIYMTNTKNKVNSRVLKIKKFAVKNSILIKNKINSLNLLDGYNCAVFEEDKDTSKQRENKEPESTLVTENNNLHNSSSNQGTTQGGFANEAKSPSKLCKNCNAGYFNEKGICKVLCEENDLFADIITGRCLLLTEKPVYSDITSFNSCKNQCGNKYISLTGRLFYSCSCESSCRKEGTCCKDYSACESTIQGSVIPPNNSNKIDYCQYYFFPNNDNINNNSSNNNHNENTSNKIIIKESSAYCVQCESGSYLYAGKCYASCDAAEQELNDKSNNNANHLPSQSQKQTNSTTRNNNANDNNSLNLFNPKENYRENNKDSTRTSIKLAVFEANKICFDVTNCSSIKNCAECGENSKQGNEFCSKCFEGFFLNNNACNLTCPFGYHTDKINGVCEKVSILEDEQIKSASATEITVFYIDQSKNKQEKYSIMMNIDSCNNNCGAEDINKPCSCNFSCLRKGTCCKDYSDFCLSEMQKEICQSCEDCDVQSKTCKTCKNNSSISETNKLKCLCDKNFSYKDNNDICITDDLESFDSLFGKGIQSIKNKTATKKAVRKPGKTGDTSVSPNKEPGGIKSSKQSTIDSEAEANDDHDRDDDEDAIKKHSRNSKLIVDKLRFQQQQQNSINDSSSNQQGDPYATQNNLKALLENLNLNSNPLLIIHHNNNVTITHITNNILDSYNSNINYAKEINQAVKQAAPLEFNNTLIEKIIPAPQQQKPVFPSKPQMPSQPSIQSESKPSVQSESQPNNPVKVETAGSLQHFFSSEKPIVNNNNNANTGANSTNNIVNKKPPLKATTNSFKNDKEIVNKFNNDIIPEKVVPVHHHHSKKEKKKTEESESMNNGDIRKIDTSKQASNKEDSKDKALSNSGLDYDDDNLNLKNNKALENNLNLKLTTFTQKNSSKEPSEKSLVTDTLKADLNSLPANNNNAAAAAAADNAVLEESLYDYFNVVNKPRSSSSKANKAAAIKTVKKTPVIAKHSNNKNNNEVDDDDADLTRLLEKSSSELTSSASSSNKRTKHSWSSLSARVNSEKQSNSTVSSEATCDDTLCLTCNSTSKKCLVCKPNAKIYDSFCDCTPGNYYAEETESCVACNWKCDACTNNRTCSTCDALKGLTQSNETIGSCECIDPSNVLSEEKQNCVLDFSCPNNFLAYDRVTKECFQAGYDSLRPRFSRVIVNYGRTYSPDVDIDNEDFFNQKVPLTKEGTITNLGYFENLLLFNYLQQKYVQSRKLVSVSTPKDNSKQIGVYSDNNENCLRSAAQFSDFVASGFSSKKLRSVLIVNPKPDLSTSRKTLGKRRGPVKQKHFRKIEEQYSTFKPSMVEFEQSNILDKSFELTKSKKTLKYSVKSKIPSTNSNSNNEDPVNDVEFNYSTKKTREANGFPLETSGYIKHYQQAKIQDIKAQQQTAGDSEFQWKKGSKGFGRLLNLMIPTDYSKEKEGFKEDRSQEHSTLKKTNNIVKENEENQAKDKDEGKRTGKRKQRGRGMVSKYRVKNSNTNFYNPFSSVKNYSEFTTHGSINDFFAAFNQTQSSVSALQSLLNDNNNSGTWNNHNDIIVDSDFNDYLKNDLLKPFEFLLFCKDTLTKVVENHELYRKEINAYVDKVVSYFDDILDIQEGVKYDIQALKALLEAYFDTVNQGISNIGKDNLLSAKATMDEFYAFIFEKVFFKSEHNRIYKELVSKSYRDLIDGIYSVVLIDNKKLSELADLFIKYYLEHAKFIDVMNAPEPTDNSRRGSVSTLQDQFPSKTAVSAVVEDDDNELSSGRLANNRESIGETSILKPNSKVNNKKNTEKAVNSGKEKLNSGLSKTSKTLTQDSKKLFSNELDNLITEFNPLKHFDESFSNDNSFVKLQIDFVVRERFFSHLISLERFKILLAKESQSNQGQSHSQENSQMSSANKENNSNSTLSSNYPLQGSLLQYDVFLNISEEDLRRLLQEIIGEGLYRVSPVNEKFIKGKILSLLSPDKYTVKVFSDQTLIFNSSLNKFILAVEKKIPAAADFSEVCSYSVTEPRLIMIYVLAVVVLLELIAVIYLSCK